VGSAARIGRLGFRGEGLSGGGLGPGWSRRWRGAVLGHGQVVQGLAQGAGGRHPARQLDVSPLDFCCRVLFSFTLALSSLPGGCQLM
jgi:hypothetical protein